MQSINFGWRSYEFERAGDEGPQGPRVSGAIVAGAARLFLQRGFGAVSMDELAEAAGVARRTLYNQFASKEDIFREVLLRVSRQLEDALPPGIETQGGVEDVLRRIARTVLELHRNAEYLGFFRMAVADSRQFPWIAEDFAAVMDPQTERFARYLEHPTTLGADCPEPDARGAPVHGRGQRVRALDLDAGPRSLAVPAEDVVEGAIADVPEALRPAPINLDSSLHGTRTVVSQRR